MFDFCRGVLFVATAFVVAGCTDNSIRLDLRVGLFFAEGTQSLTMRFEPHHYPVMDTKDDVPVGKEIVSALTRATRHVFAFVEVLDSYPTKESIAYRRLNLVVVVQVRPAGGSLGYKGDSILNSSQARRSLAAELTCYDFDMIEFVAVTSSGEGNARSKGILFDSRRRAFVRAMKSAIRNLGDDVALQMSSNPEIRKMVKKVNAIIPP